ncbi:hypothetical protein ACYSNM_08280 [Myroides sp. LJL116]
MDDKERLDNLKEEVNIYGEYLGHKKEYLQEINTTINNTSNLVNTIGGIGELYIENKRLDVANLALQRDIIQITSNHKEKMTIIKEVFSERGKMLDKTFQIVDKALTEDNDSLLFSGLKAMDSLAKHNPLQMLEKVNEIKIDPNNEEPLQLDF